MGKGVMIKKQRRDTLRHTVTVTADRQTRGRQRHADLLIYRPVLETPSHHTTTGSPPSVERQKKHQHHIDDDEEEQDDKDHDPLGLRVHVAAEESVKRAPFVPASLGGLCHSFSPQRKKKKEKNHKQASLVTAVQPTAGARVGAEGWEQKLFCSSHKERSEWSDTAMAGRAQHVCRTPPPRALISGGRPSAHPWLATSSPKEPSPSR